MEAVEVVEVAVAAAAAAAAAAATVVRACDKRTMRRTAPPCLSGNFCFRAMVDGIGENDILCEL
jgi:hypothetical protein